MNADRLLEHFDRISDAADAVDRLRSLVLSVAYQGRLLAGRSTTNWRPATVGEIATEITPGLACAKSHQQADGCVHLRTHNVATNGKMNFDLLVRITPGKIDRGKRGLKKGDILFNNTNSQELVGKTCLVHDTFDFAFSNHITRIRLCNEVDPAFFVNCFMHLLRTGFFARLCNRWIGQAGINTSALKAVPLSIPPLEEQQRIVAKVAELMALCDRLEAAQVERETRRDRLVSASLARVTEPASEAPSSARTSARFHLDHFARLTTRPEHVKQLRKTILNLAVRGRLVRQLRHEEPAEHVVAGVGAPPLPPRYNKRSLETVMGSCGLAINHPKTVPPSGWMWVPLIRIARLESGHTPSRNRPDWWNGDVPWIGLADARTFNNGVINTTTQSTNAEGLANSAARLLPAGTVCFSRTASVGYVVIMGRAMATSQDFVNWVPTNAVTSEWIQLVLMAERPALDRFSKGAVHQTIYYPAWISMHIVLPPLAEQRRIVAKVDELMALCDQLETCIASDASNRARLLEALLHEALAPAA